mgnify:CR=1 FL=1
MFKYLRAQCAFATLLAITAACGSKPPDLSGLPQALLLLPGATEIKTEKASDGGANLLYQVNGTEFPALGTIAQIRMYLEKLGWTPLTRYWLDPSMALDWKFRSFTDGRKTPNERVHQWDGQWTNSKGEVVWYSLSYRSKLSDDILGEPDNTRLHVAVIHVPQEAVRAARQGITAPLK